MHKKEDDEIIKMRMMSSMIKSLVHKKENDEIWSELRVQLRVLDQSGEEQEITCGAGRHQLFHLFHSFFLSFSSSFLKLCSILEVTILIPLLFLVIIMRTS